MNIFSASVKRVAAVLAPYFLAIILVVLAAAFLSKLGETNEVGEGREVLPETRSLSCGSFQDSGKFKVWRVQGKDLSRHLRRTGRSENRL